MIYGVALPGERHITRNEGRERVTQKVTNRREHPVQDASQCQLVFATRLGKDTEYPT